MSERRNSNCPMLVVMCPSYLEPTFPCPRTFIAPLPSRNLVVGRRPVYQRVAQISVRRVGGGAGDGRGYQELVIFSHR